jgi:hypothetical protein
MMRGGTHFRLAAENSRKLNSGGSGRLWTGA